MKATVEFLLWVRAENPENGGLEKVTPLSENVREMGALVLTNRFVNPMKPVLEITHFVLQPFVMRDYISLPEGLEAHYSTAVGGWVAVYRGRQIVIPYRHMIYVEEPISPPKTRLETRWQGGRWQKRTARGWV